MDPKLALALSIQSNPGVYAVLLGSGVSRTAQIPTGWEITLDLVRKVAAMEGREIAGDPVEWFERTYGLAPDYSVLLSRLGAGAAERQRILRKYFEPTAEERAEGIKTPTAAHAAIARLAERGSIRLIVTTNFDRLMEQALDLVGVVPTVITNADAAKGAPPLAHSGVTVIKLHGDYLDARIKNTAEELAAYSGAMRKLLDRVLDEFGLIVAGWSGRWDTALRSALNRCKSHRYATYWTGIEEPSEDVAGLLRLRRAQFIRISDADHFFIEIAEKVEALDELDRPHPLSVAVAVQTVKRLIPDERATIRLHDLILSEADRVAAEVTSELFPAEGIELTDAAFTQRVRRFEAVSEILMAMVATAGFWGEQRQETIIARCIERLAVPTRGSGYVALLGLRRYPALLTMYAGGIAAMANERYGNLRALLITPEVAGDDRPVPAVLGVQKHDVFTQDSAKQFLPDMRNKKTPESTWMEQVLREPLRPFIPSDTSYQEAFDRFEYLVGLVHASRYERLSGGVWGPFGSFGWRGRYGGGRHPHIRVAEEIEAMGEGWPAYTAGLFPCTLDRLREVKKQYDDLWSRSEGMY